LAQFKLIPYKIGVREKGIKGRNLNLFQIEFFDFLSDIFNKYSHDAQDHHKFFVDEEKKRILFFQDIKISKRKGEIIGTIQSGDYGRVSDCVDVEQRELLEEYIKENQSVLTRNHFFIRLKEDVSKTNAFLQLSVLYNQSIKVLFEKMLNTEFKKRYPDDLLLRIEAIITSEDAIDRFLKANSIFEIQFTRKIDSREITDGIDADNFEEIEEVRTFRVARKRNIVFTKGREWIAGEIKNKETKLLTIKGVKYDSGVIRMIDREEQKTFDIDTLKIQERKVMFEEHLEFDENNWPTLESVYKFAEKYFTEIEEKYD